MAVGYRGGLITGKIGGDVGYMVKNAKGRTSQGWRAYQAHVSNPNNQAQRLNRVILSTMAKAYSVLRPICDHSFEGIAGPSRNQKEFAKQNIHILQDAVINSIGNFNPRNEFRMLVNRYMLSKGSLPSLMPTYNSTNVSVGLPNSIADEIPTLGQLFDTMGWTDSGQITVLICIGEGEPDVIAFKYARFVFKLGEPYNMGQGAKATRDTALYTAGQGGTFDLHFNVSASEGVDNFAFNPLIVSSAFGGLVFAVPASVLGGGEINAVGAINSSLVGNIWKRSTQFLDPNDDGSENYSLDKAIASYSTVQSSAQYLNNGGRIILNG